MFFKTYWILGQNARNLNYIKWYNDKIAKNLADSKLKTKDFLSKKWIKVPKTLFIFKHHWDLNEKLFDSLEPPFVVKPNNWFWGKGIYIFESKDSIGNYISNMGEVFSKKKLLNHFTNILDWFFSISWLRDRVIIEKKVVLNTEIELLWKYWLPDIRIVVFNMVPIMAMLRVPTSESGGKANLHAGACWVWIDLWTWKLTYITSHSKIIKSIPNIWDVRGIKIPHWEEVLTIAVSVQQKTNIWYLGCDIVLDEKDGPLLLEMNIRSGLEVQVANIAPLKTRLERVEWVNINSVEKWVRLGRDLFSWDIEDKIKNISWKKVLGLREYLTIEYKDKKYKYLAEVKVSYNSSIIDKDFAKNILKIDDEKLASWFIRFKTTLLWEDKKMKFIIKDLENINVIIWINSMKWFIIDPYKYRKWESPISDNIDFIKWKNWAINKSYTEQLINIDKKLLSIDKKLLVSRYFTPTNLYEEKQKFIKSKWDYIPVFEYNDITLDLEKIEIELEQIEINDIPLASIYIRKKEEILNKIALFKALILSNNKDITYYSKKIFWDIIPEYLVDARNILSNISNIKNEDDFLTFDEIKDYVRKFNNIYWIKIKLKEENRSARFVMKWDILLVRKWAKVWKKEMRSIIAHEIEGHYLRKINWRNMKYSIFSHWTSGYLKIDEWIAIYNQNRFLSDTDRKSYSIYERYFFVNYALKHSYKKLLSKMLDYYDNDYEKVFNYISRLKKWFKDISEDGVFVRDVVYVNWYLDVKNYINQGGSLKELYLWKVSIEDIDVLKNSYFVKLNFNDLKLPFSL